MSLASQRDLDTAAERALVEQSRLRNYDAFARIVDAYQARVYGFVRRMVRHEEDALDVTQEVFIRAFKGLHSFDGRSSLRTWLFRIAYHLCIDRSRRVDRSPVETSLEPAHEGEVAFEASDDRWNPERMVLDHELRLAVDSAVESMSDKLRTVLLLHDREDMGYEEIAQAIDVPVGTVKSRLFLARAHVQKHVGAYLSGETVL